METELVCPCCGVNLVDSATRCVGCEYPLEAPESARIRANNSRQSELQDARRRVDAELSWLVGERSHLLGAVYARYGRANSAADWVGVPGRSVSEASLRPEWDYRRIRTVLLWLGSALLVLSAMGFSGYEWTRLGPGGRSIVLVAVALVACSAAGMLRRRLPATAEAMAAIGPLLIVVDWALFRRAGLAAGLSADTWWAIGSALVAAAALGLGSLGLAAGRVIGALSAAAALPLTLDIVLPVAKFGDGHAIQVTLIWTAMVAVTLVPARLLWSNPRWRVSGIALQSAAGALQVIAYLSTLNLGVRVLGDMVHPPLLGGVAVAATGIGPWLARSWWCADPDADPRSRPWCDICSYATTASVIAGSFVALSGIVPSRWLWVTLTVLAAASFALTRITPSARSASGVRAASATAAVVGGLACLVPALEAVLVPLGWWARGWTGSLSWSAALHLSGGDGSGVGSGGGQPSWQALVGLVALSIWVVISTDWSSGNGRVGGPNADSDGVPAGAHGGIYGGVPAGRPIVAAPKGFRLLRGGVAAVLLTVLSVPTLAMLPVVTGADIAEVIAFLVLVIVGAVGLHLWATRRREPWAILPLLVAGASGVTCLGWCTVTQVSTVIVLGLAALLCAAVWITAAAESVRRVVCSTAGVVFVLAWVGVVGAAAGVGPAAVCLAVTCVAGAVVVFLQVGTDDLSTRFAEGVGVAGLVLPDIWELAQRSWFYLAGSLTAAVVAGGLAWLVAGAAGGRQPRPLYRWGSMVLTAPLAWSWLGATGVHLVEAYTCGTALVITAVMVGVARVERQAGRQTSSWRTFGPGLTVALLPSTILAISEGGLVRPMCLSWAAVMIVIVGVGGRLRAPIVCGGVTLIALGLNAAFPYIAEGPRWLTLGAAGGVLIWIGATIDHRLAGLRSLRVRYQHLG